MHKTYNPLGFLLARCPADDAGKVVNRKKAGATLLDVLLGVLVIGLVVAGANSLYSQVTEGNRTNQAISQLTAITGSARALFQNRQDFTGLDTQLLINAGGVPDNQVSGTDIQHPWNDNMAIAPGTTPTLMTVTYTNLPQSACVRIVTDGMGAMGSSNDGSENTTTATTIGPVGAGTTCNADPIDLTLTFTK